MRWVLPLLFLTASALSAGSATTYAATGEPVLLGGAVFFALQAIACPIIALHDGGDS